MEALDELVSLDSCERLNTEGKAIIQVVSKVSHFTDGLSFHCSASHVGNLKDVAVPFL